jgi:hypothetical protein
MSRLMPSAFANSQPLRYADAALLNDPPSKRATDSPSYVSRSMIASMRNP